MLWITNLFISKILSAFFSLIKVHNRTAKFRRI